MECEHETASVIYDRHGVTLAMCNKCGKRILSGTPGDGEWEEILELRCAELELRCAELKAQLAETL